MIRRILQFVLLLVPGVAFAQYTTVSATVPTMVNATFVGDFVNLNTTPGAPPPLLGGISPFQQQVTGQFDGSGHFSTRVATNSQVIPAPSQWKFNFCVQSPSPPSPICFNVQFTATGTTQDISSLINAVIPPIPGPGNSIVSNPHATQTITQPSGTNFNVNTSGGGKFNYNGVEVLASANVVQTTPSATQTVTQPTGTSLDVNTLNHVFNASLYTGSDIGAKVNAAIAAAVAAYGGGIVQIPAGTYTMTTAVTIPQGVIVTGQGDKTIINWHGTNAAFVLSNVDNPGIYVQGSLRDIAMFGTSTTNQIGVYQGGDPNSVISPSTNIGYNYTMRNVHINQMDIGIYWGHGAFNIQWDNVISSYNKTFGWYYPSTSTFGGQNNNFYHSQFANNASGAWFIRQTPAVTFDMFGMDIEYNGNATVAPSVNPQMDGGNVICYSCHVENGFGPLVAAGGNNDGMTFYGGIWVVNGTGTTEASIVKLNAGRASFIMSGTTIIVNHTITSMVTQAAGSNLPQIDIRNINLVDTGDFLSSLTTITGPSVSWCLPYNNATGVNNGYCYDGKIYNNGITSSSNNPSKASLTGSSASMIWNATGTDGDVGLINTFNGASNSNVAFSLWSNNGGTFGALSNFYRNGDMYLLGSPNVFGAYKYQGNTGVTTTATAGSCVIHITGGIITSLTGTC